MMRGRRFVAAVAVSSLLAAGFSFGATTTAYAAGGTPANLESFCSHLSDYISYLEGLRESRLRNFLLHVAEAVFSNHCTQPPA